MATRIFNSLHHAIPDSFPQAASASPAIRAWEMVEFAGDLAALRKLAAK
jgi:hypothetical protein